MIIAGNSKIEYFSSGMFKSELPWIHIERTIDTYEIILVLKNSIYIKEEDEEYALSEGDILLLEPFKLHKGFKASENGCAFYWLHFYADELDINFKKFSTIKNSAKDTALFFISQIIHISHTPAFKRELADALCFSLVEYLSVAHKTSFTKSDKITNEICEYIRLNINKPLTVADIAKYFSYNPDYLSLLFKVNTTLTLKEYIDNARITHAKTLLVSSDYSIKQIAYIMQFTTSQNFISFFKYHEKTTPLKYRNKNTGVHYNN